MKLCDYGCGREGKYKIYFKNSSKYCCEKQWRKCPNLNKSTTIEKIKKKIKGIKRSEETKKRMSESAYRRYESKDERKKQSERMKIVQSDMNLRAELSRKQKLRFSDPKEREKHSLILTNAYKKPEVRIKTKRDIEKLKVKYPTFSKIEDLRYNPDKPGEKEIQVHCKNHNCPNSKEKDGWFTPTGRQIEHRIYSIENINGNDGGYFYCSEECKNECCLYRFRKDPIELSEYELYKNLVIKQTEYNIKKYPERIKNIQKRSREFPIDHKYSIYEGFKNNIDFKIISHWCNLEIIERTINSKKQEKCSVKINELMRQIKEQKYDNKKTN